MGLPKLAYLSASSISAAAVAISIWSRRSATAAATPAAADDGESAEELRRKVARLKRLLRAAGVALASKAAESG